MTITTDVQLLRNRRTRIVSTLGPASSDAGTIARLIEAGADVFRLNSSHGDHDGHRAVFGRVRAAPSPAAPSSWSTARP